MKRKSNMTTKTVEETKEKALTGEKQKSGAKAGGPKIKTALPGPKAKAAIEKDKHWISGRYTRSYQLVAKRGRGAIVEEVDGNELLYFAEVNAVCGTGLGQLV